MIGRNGSNGILPSQEIKRMVRLGQISAEQEVPDAQIQPASIDLRLGSKGYRVRASFLRGRSATFLTRVQQLLEAEIDLSQSALLEPGIVYILPLIEHLSLPSDIQGVANPKSTTGRLDIFTRLITEHGDLFDRVPPGYKGRLFVEVSSRTFPIRVRSGMRLNQLRFIRGNATEPIVNGELQELAAQEPLVYDNNGNPTMTDIADGVRITVDLEGDVVAYKAKTDAPVIELDKLRHYDPEDYWETIKPRHGNVILAKGGFYLLASKRRVSVPLNCAAEMIAHNPTMGEFRVHYAGFFDPGFGYGVRRGDIQGTKAVLEVRAYEVPIVLEDDHVVGRLHYYRMADLPDKVYGASELGSSYQRQGLALSKQFKCPDATRESAVTSAHVAQVAV